jgi:hypothetical protein
VFAWGTPDNPLAGEAKEQNSDTILPQARAPTPAHHRALFSTPTAVTAWKKNLWGSHSSDTAPADTLQNSALQGSLGYIVRPWLDKQQIEKERLIANPGEERDYNCFLIKP